MAESQAIAATLDPPNKTLPRQRAVLFIVFLGIVSLFGDMTYEGARSITGPYLGVLPRPAHPRKTAASRHRKANSRERQVHT